ncbi:MAG: hypothetical protein L3K10_05720 [Thermoplasmata archaeon]|nr:hypothetical protein [Thermoplasmata archaeon]
MTSRSVGAVLFALALLVASPSLWAPAQASPATGPPVAPFGAQSHDFVASPTGPFSGDPTHPSLASLPATPATTSGTNPRAVRASNSPTSAGVEYSGATVIAPNVQTTMEVPDDLPAASDLYYVALSAFDGAQSYDQLGFANDNGSWQVFYAVAATCGTRPVQHFDAFPLTRGSTYSFNMSIYGGGVILFEVLQGTAGEIWQETAHTGGTYFEVWPSQNCGTKIVPGFTETEVLYSTASAVPPYNFVFLNTVENGRPESSWVNLPASTAPASVVHNVSTVTIYNERFSVAFAQGLDTYSIEAAFYPQQLETMVSVSVFALSSANISLGNYTVPALWKVSASPLSANVSFSSQVSLSIPTGVAPGTYVVGIEAGNGSGSTNRIALVVHVLPGLNLTILPHPASGQVDANETVTFLPNATGGLPGYTYTWSVLPLGCTWSGSEATCRFASPGLVVLDSGVTDGLHYIEYRNQSFQVLPDPVLTATSGVVTVQAGDALSLAASLTGGLPPFVVRWTGLPPGCSTVNGTLLSCHPVGTGRYSVTVAAADSTGFRTSLTFVAQVQTPGGSSLLSGTNGTFVLVGSALVALIAVCAIVLVRRRKT